MRGNEPQIYIHKIQQVHWYLCAILVTVSLLGAYLFNNSDSGADLFAFYFLFKSEKVEKMQK